MLILSYIKAPLQVYNGIVYSYILIGIFTLSLIWAAYEFARKMERIQKATQKYNDVLKIDPKDMIALNNKGTAFAELNEHQKAIKYFDKVIELNSEDAAAWHNKGVILAKLGKNQESLEYLDKALKLDSRFEFAKKSGEIILEY